MILNDVKAPQRKRNDENKGRVVIELSGIGTANSPKDKAQVAWSFLARVYTMNTFLLLLYPFGFFPSHYVFAFFLLYFYFSSNTCYMFQFYSYILLRQEVINQCVGEEGHLHFTESKLHNCSIMLPIKLWMLMFNTLYKMYF